MFRSTGNGDTWSAVNNGITAKDVWAMVVTPNDNVFAGAMGGGVFRSTDSGGSWSQVNNGLDVPFVTSLATNSSGHIFAGTVEGDARSVDNGDTWTLESDGLTNTWVNALAVNATDDLFAGTFGGGMFRSTDSGDNWEPINDGLGTNAILSICVNNAGHLFVGADFGERTFKSIDNGENCTPPIGTSNNIDGIAVAPNGDLYACNSVRTASSIRLINGHSWMPMSNGLTATYVLSVAVNSSGHVFAGTYFGGGVFRSTDSGTNWNEINVGLTATDVRALAVTGTTILRRHLWHRHVPLTGPGQ